MAAGWKLDRCRQRIEGLIQAGLPWEVLGGEIVRHVRQVVGFDGWCVSVSDPVTGLPTAAASQDSPLSSCQRRFWQLEYLVPDVGKADDLAAAGRRVAVLSHETGGDLARSRRWDELLRPAGTVDELRGILRADGMPWGSLTLYRSGSGNQFSEDDIRAVETIQHPLTVAARTSWTARPPEAADRDEPPATLIATTEGTLIDATPTADSRLARLGVYRQAGYTLVYALLARLAADMNRDGGGHPSASVVTRTTDGRWVELHAAPLTGHIGSGQRVAVTVRPAPSPRIRTVLLHAYALTERERQVASLAADGLPTRKIATTLYISSHTVRDHLKAVFGKTRSHTRQELAARLSGSGS